ncbi:MAG: hypothetical protein DLM56_01735 [Pseudonocardiales bacterium]|nr:MAG: hypothetical protein DLM56_01735 [Pseudonocardiales bacterium]
MNRLACVVGPLIAAELVAGVGPAPALVADAVSFVLAAVIVGIGVPEARRATPPMYRRSRNSLRRLGLRRIAHSCEAEPRTCGATDCSPRSR